MTPFSYWPDVDPDSADSLGVPEGTLTKHIVMPGGEFESRWTDYTVELVVASGGPETGRSLVIRSPTLGPQLAAELEEVLPGSVGRLRDYRWSVYKVIVRHVHSIQAYWEWSCHPDGPPTLRLHGDLLDLSPDILSALLDGRHLIRTGYQVPRRGRPVGSTNIEPRRVRPVYFEVVANLRRLRLKLTKEAVAAQMEISPRTLTRYMKKHGLPWPPPTARRRAPRGPKQADR